MYSSIALSPADNKYYQQAVITFRLIPVRWSDGTQSDVAVVDQPPQSETLEDRPIIINWLDIDSETAVTI